MIGVVTGNFRSFTVPDEIVEKTRCGEIDRTVERRVITYGVAANIFNACDAIEKILGRRLPDPEPERYP